MATNYDEYMKEMFPQTASDATKQYYTGQQENIDKAYVEGANTLGSNKDQTIAQAYLSYLKATNPYGSSAEQRSNAGLSASGGYAGVTRGYAEMAQANSKIAANNTYQSGMTNLAANRDAAQTNLLGNYASMLSTDETNAYNKKQTALSNSAAYMENVVDNFDTYDSADESGKAAIKQSWKDTMIKLYGLDDETADTLINSYTAQINSGVSISDNTANNTTTENGTAVNTSVATTESPIAFTTAKGEKGKAGVVYTIGDKKYNIAWRPVLDSTEAAKWDAAVANIKNPVGGNVYQGNDGNYYYYFGETDNIWSGKWRQLEEEQS